MRAWTRFSVVQHFSWALRWTEQLYDAIQKSKHSAAISLSNLKNVWNYYGFDENPDSAWIWNWNSLLILCGSFAISDKCTQSRVSKYQIKVVSGSIKTWIILKLLVWAHALVSSLVRTHFTTYLIFNPTIQITIWKIQVETVDILSLVTNQMKFSSESWLFWIFNEANISANLWLRSSSLWQARISSGLQSSDLAILEFYVSVNSSIYEELVT